MINKVFSLTGAMFKNSSFSFSFKPYSNVLIVTDNANWSVAWDMLELKRIANKLKVPSRLSPGVFFRLPRQSIFLPTKYILLDYKRYLLGWGRIAFPYFHGYPEHGSTIANKCFNNLKKYHHRVDRIQVSHKKMHDYVLETGIDPAKVFQIRIGINPDFFQQQTLKLKKKMRNKYGIPHQAVVIGSFQKDGNGWEEGLTPKLIKGPDIFVQTLKILKDTIPDLFVLLSGPARGYVIKNLEKQKIPYKHFYLDDYSQIGELYQCLDCYIVTSREEGGPKAVLESMASGIPLITTKVGQAMELVQHQQNGWMVDIEDAEALAFWTKEALTDSKKLQVVLDAGLRTAKENTYDSQLELWRNFYDGFVEN